MHVWKNILYISIIFVKIHSVSNAKQQLILTIWIIEAIIGESLSEPHTDVLNVTHVCLSILRVLASFVNSKTIHKLLSENSTNRIPLRWQQQGRRPLVDLPIQSLER